MEGHGQWCFMVPVTCQARQRSVFGAPSVAMGTCVAKLNEASSEDLSAAYQDLPAELQAKLKEAL